MKVAISYPPIINSIGQKAMVSQNRNVQYFKKPTYLLPVIHAQAASLLKKNGFDVLWDDGNAQLKSFDEWSNDLSNKKPDVIVLESTTPVMQYYWDLSSRLKELLPKTILIMTGYHSMRKPIESFNNSKIDVVITSNHIDFVILRLLSFIKNNSDWRKTCKVPGVFIKNENEIRDNG